MRYHELQCAPTPAEEMVSLDQTYRDFDCPQCVPMVLYRKVRAVRVVSDYDVDRARKFQEPIKRGLAAVFGEYLFRKGLITFTADESERLSSGNIKIIAEMGIVNTKDAETAGAAVEAVETDPPPLSPILQRQLTWTPDRLQPEPVQFRRSKSTAEKVREVRESREGAQARFSGLELFQDDGEIQ
jgi:predicted RNA-binding Zn-ribbon protein involved in translation (DUF1610 family)